MLDRALLRSESGERRGIARFVAREPPQAGTASQARRAQCYHAYHRGSRFTEFIHNPGSEGATLDKGHGHAKAENSMPQPDRRSGLVRRIWPDEKEAYRALLKRLDPQTRRDRFCGAVSDAYVDEHVEHTWRTGACVFGAFVEHSLRGAAELHRTSSGGIAEAGLVVERGYQNGGIGTALLEAIVAAAGHRGCRSIRIACLRTNWSMRRLAMKAEAQLMLTFDEIHGEIIPPSGRARFAGSAQP
jgi:GNAT superfamily N-acetyltransferase